MDKQLLKGSFTGGSYEIAIVASDVQASVTYDGADFEGTVSLKIKSKAGLDHLKVIIPGTIDDAIINVVEAALAL